jgi:hypothetical protein
MVGNGEAPSAVLRHGKWNGSKAMEMRMRIGSLFARGPRRGETSASQGRISGARASLEWSAVGRTFLVKVQVNGMAILTISKGLEAITNSCMTTSDRA